ncbi:MAG: AAA family ATPase [Thermoguttaceae bacterium]|jgi:Cdc6-like AAA superfamily ATPase
MAKKVVSDEHRMNLMVHAGEVFSPTAPIDKRDLFAGRIQQLMKVMDVTNTRGQHAVIFGERGVGKTSLANIVTEVLASGGAGSVVSVKVNCSSDDTFYTMWRKILREVVIDEDSGAATVGFRAKPRTKQKTADSLLPDKPAPSDARRAVERLGECVLIFDEFDRLGRGKSTALFADTIKELSDVAAPATVIIVGVASSIDGLIKEHRSVERALCQILMPRMTNDELGEIVQKALGQLEMDIDSDARNLIVALSQGLPHYTHLLGKAACRSALEKNSLRITAAHVKSGIARALEDTQQSVRTSYQEATTSPRKDTLFKQVLLACALAPVDDLGYFFSADVRDPLSTIAGKHYDIPGFSQHLDKFSSDRRGNVLEKAGTQRRFRFRFQNPLLQPYVIMRGIVERLLSGDALAMLQTRMTSQRKRHRG